MIEKCNSCKHACFDFVQLYGSTAKHWFFDFCKKDLEPSEDCEEWEEYEEREEE